MNCQNHPNKRSVATCVICGKSICDKCRLKIAGEDYCQDCVTEIVATEASKRSESQETPKNDFNRGIEEKYEKYLDDLYYNEDKVAKDKDNSEQMSLKEQLARDEAKYGSIVRKSRKATEPIHTQEISQNDFDNSNLRSIKIDNKDKKNRRSLHSHIHSGQKKKKVEEESTTTEVVLSIILIVMMILVTSYIIYLFTLADNYPNFLDAMFTLFSNPVEVINNMFS